MLIQLLHLRYQGSSSKSYMQFVFFLFCRNGTRAQYTASGSCSTKTVPERIIFTTIIFFWLFSVRQNVRELFDLFCGMELFLRGCSIAAFCILFNCSSLWAGVNLRVSYPVFSSQLCIALPERLPRSCSCCFLLWLLCSLVKNCT